MPSAQLSRPIKLFRVSNCCELLLCGHGTPEVPTDSTNKTLSGRKAPLGCITARPGKVLPALLTKSISSVTRTLRKTCISSWGHAKKTISSSHIYQGCEFFIRFIPVVTSLCVCSEHIKEYRLSQIAVSTVEVDYCIMAVN